MNPDLESRECPDDATLGQRETPLGSDREAIDAQFRRR
jgi:hypothetical protein